MKICALFSGGKDSTYALHWAVLKGFKISNLLTFQPRREDSWMFHRPGVEVTKLQAVAIGFPLYYAYTSGVKDKELEDLKNSLMEVKRKFGVEGVITGALLSDYQRMAINLICEELNLKTFSPLWRKNQAEYMRTLINEGFKFIITSINACGITSKFLGKILTEEDIEEIILRAEKYGFNPAFEGGEAETLVLEAPLFKKGIKIIGIREKINEYSWRFKIVDAKLVAKGAANVEVIKDA